MFISLSHESLEKTIQGILLHKEFRHTGSFHLTVVPLLGDPFSVVQCSGLNSCVPGSRKEAGKMKKGQRHSSSLLRMVFRSCCTRLLFTLHWAEHITTLAARKPGTCSLPWATMNSRGEQTLVNIVIYKVYSEESLVRILQEGARGNFLGWCQAVYLYRLDDTGVYIFQSSKNDPLKIWAFYFTYL